MIGCGTVLGDDYTWPPVAGDGYERRLQVGDVVLTTSETWWLVVGPHAQVGQNSVLIYGPQPKGFRDRRTHWSDEIVRGQQATVNPPQPWPDEVCVAVAAFKLSGVIPS